MSHIMFQAQISLLPPFVTFVARQIICLPVPASWSRGYLHIYQFTPNFSLQITDQLCVSTIPSNFSLFLVLSRRTEKVIFFFHTIQVSGNALSIEGSTIQKYLSVWLTTSILHLLKSWQLYSISAHRIVNI